MELTESIESINQQLIDLFGIDTITGLSIWRIVFSEDQFEKRLGTYEDYSRGGIFLREVTEVREVPKYRQWIQCKYVLERLVVVPEINERELPTSKLSYEPIWVFEDRFGNALPPVLRGAKLVIDTVYAAMGKAGMAKYKDPELDAENALELKRQEVDKIQEELYGDESGLGGAIVHGEGVGYTGPSKMN